MEKNTNREMFGRPLDLNVLNVFVMKVEWRVIDSCVIAAILMLIEIVALNVTLEHLVLIKLLLMYLFIVVNDGSTNVKHANAW